LKEKWVYLFPTIVKKAQTIEVLESGSLGNRNGALQLVCFPENLASCDFGITISLD